MSTTQEAPKATAEKSVVRQERNSVVIRFAGDSGDGMQIIGEKFSDSSVMAGNDISTFPDYPAEIRAPAGTLPGISGFQVHFGSREILTPGDEPDALIVMNPAALKGNLADLTLGGLLVVNTDAFVEANLDKAGYEKNPLDDPELARRYRLVKIDITQLTMDALAESPLRSVDKSRCKNFFALGFSYWVYDRPIQETIKWLERKFKKKADLADGSVRALKAGYYFGETAEIEIPRYTVQRAPIGSGVYRKVSGNEAITLGLVAASELSFRDIVFGGYPITPASSILEGMAHMKNYGVKMVQAEDEIAAIGIAIGASFAGQLGVTATSGPGLALMGEFLGLAVMTELPIVVVNVQRGGPSTGLPTKTEQADLLQAVFGRNGECPLPVLAASSPSDCFSAAIEAVRLALTYCTPVILLSDGYIANGSEPWRVPSVKSLPNLVVAPPERPSSYKIYGRDAETLARRIAFPGRRGFEHQIGGLEKDESGKVSYDPQNHHKMVSLRAAKVQGVAKSYPPTQVHGDAAGKVLVLGWGGTYGSITAAVDELRAQGKSVSSVHLRHIFPLPDDLGGILGRFEKVLIPELNLGQLAQTIRARYLLNVETLWKVQGRPFTVKEVSRRIMELL